MATPQSEPNLAADPLSLGLHRGRLTGSVVGRAPELAAVEQELTSARGGMVCLTAEDDPDGRGDLFGRGVIWAARIAALAQGGEILAANGVRELAEGKGFMFGDRGEVALRGFDDPVRLFEVRWRE